MATFSSGDTMRARPAVVGPPRVRTAGSLHRPVTPAEVAAEYTRACRARAEHERSRWGSEEGMLNRMRLAMRAVDWSGASSWLDVGCGSGRLFAEAEAAGIRVQRRVGVDVTPAMIDAARRRIWSSPVELVCDDAAVAGCRLAAPTGFDVVTAVGVLQRCGHPADAMLRALAGSLRPGGQLFITTKHVGWALFRDGSLEPDPGHSWFDLDELLVSVEDAGLAVIRCSGFLPRENTVVEPFRAHTVFLLGQRR